MENKEEKTIIRIPFDLLPEAKLWGIGHNYRVKVVLKQVGMDESGVTFELVDASSLTHEDKLKRNFMSGNTYHE